MKFKEIKNLKLKEVIQTPMKNNKEEDEKENKNAENSIRDVNTGKLSDSFMSENSNEDQFLPVENLFISNYDSNSSENEDLSSKKGIITPENKIYDKEKQHLQIKEIVNLKAVLLGGSKVGKTSIILRFVSNSFKTELDKTIKTVYSAKTIDLENEGKSVLFELWDTPSQEVYKTVDKDFYKNVNIIILVYDLNNKETYDEIKNYWIIEAKKYSDENTCKLFY